MRNRSTIQCSRCKADAELVSLGPVVVDHCVQCGNVWFDNSELEKASLASDGPLGGDFRDAIRCMGPANSRPLGPAVLSCPFCSNGLVRRPHPSLQTVVAHVCAAHGAWVERVHLLALVAAIDEHGLAGLGKLQRRHDQDRADRERSADAHIRHLQTIRLRRG
jgi:Zn-finger nucleic acid-binding protein